MKNKIRLSRDVFKDFSVMFGIPFENVKSANIKFSPNEAVIVDIKMYAGFSDKGDDLINSKRYKLVEELSGEDKPKALTIKGIDDCMDGKEVKRLAEKLVQFNSGEDNESNK